FNSRSALRCRHSLLFSSYYKRAGVQLLNLKLNRVPFRRCLIFKVLVPIAKWLKKTTARGLALSRDGLTIITDKKTKVKAFFEFF
ncbi:MAG: hypothetical protein IJR60_06755, partial [Eubacterium sp.]|nr:hypothetical protein [Eubacterium sp.]